MAKWPLRLTKEMKKQEDEAKQGGGRCNFTNIELHSYSSLKIENLLQFTSSAFFTLACRNVTLVCDCCFYLDSLGVF